MFVTSSFCQFLKMQNIENLTLEGVTIFFKRQTQVAIGGTSISFIIFISKKG